MFHSREYNQLHPFYTCSHGTHYYACIVNTVLVYHLCFIPIEVQHAHLPAGSIVIGVKSRMYVDIDLWTESEQYDTFIINCFEFSPTRRYCMACLVIACRTVWEYGKYPKYNTSLESFSYAIVRRGIIIKYRVYSMH